VIRHFQERMPYGLFVPDVPVALVHAQDLLPTPAADAG